MATPGEMKPTIGGVFSGLGIILVIVAVGFGMISLGNPYFAIVQIALFADALILTAFRLKECFQLAKDSPFKSKLTGISSLLFLGTIPIFSHLNDVIQSKDHDFIQLALNACVFFALYYSLDLVAALLKTTIAKVEPSGSVGG